MRDEVLKFVSESLDLWTHPPGRVIDIGSMDVNGTVRPIFEGRGWKYLGVDRSRGPNVDLVVDAVELGCAGFSKPFECVVSCETLEHMEDPVSAALVMRKFLSDGGLMILTAAGNGFQEHRHPIDCWRILPDGMKCLLRDLSDIVVVETPGAWARGIMGRGWKIA